MTTNGPSRGVTTAGFWPDPAAAVPDYSTPDKLQPPTVDAEGNFGVRGPVLTDEGGFRDNFAGSSLSAEWFSSVMAGTIVVANGLVTISTAAPPVANGIQYISRDGDYYPIILNVLLGQQGGASPFNLSGRAGSTMEAFFGLYKLDEVANPNRDPSHATALEEYVEWTLLASGGATNGSEQRSAAHAGSGGTQVNSGTATSRATPGWRTIAVDGEGAVFRDGATANNALPTPTVRANNSGQIPDLYTPLFFSAGIRNLSAPGASQGILVIDAVFLKNLDRLIVNTVF